MTNLPVLEQLTPIPWSTPTPYPTPVATVPIDFSFESIQGSEIAENVVSGWQMINQGGVLDMIFWAVIVAIVISGIVSVKRHLEDA